IVTKSLQIRYTTDWKPLELTLDAMNRNQALGIHMTVAGTAATTHLNNAGQPVDRVDTIDPDSVLVFNPFFAGYEAVAHRLTTAAVGSAIPVYQGAPATTTAKRTPAVVLVAGSGPVDRDGSVAGIPVFGQLASALADAGFTVLRYDKRGVGQSGGRIETASLTDYADDLRAAVKYMADRKDIDPKRV